MTASNDLNYYLKVAIDINKKVGGSRAYQAESNNRDRFVVIRDNVNKNMHFVRTKLEERERRRGGDTTALNNQVKERIAEIFDQLARMRETVSYEKGTNPAAQELKFQLVEGLLVQTKELQAALEGDGETTRALMGGQTNQTYTEMRSQLLDPSKTKAKSTRIKATQNEPTEMQATAMKRWEDTDKQIDAGVDKLIENTKKWKEGVLKTGALIDETDEKIQKLTVDVDKVNQDLFKSNKQLKGVVQKFRKPHKFCLDIVMVLILIGLIVAIVKLAKK